MKTRSLLSITASNDRIGFAFFEDKRLVEYGSRKIGSVRQPTYSQTLIKRIHALARRFEPHIGVLPAFEDRHLDHVRWRVSRVAKLILADAKTSMVECADATVREHFERTLNTKRPTRHRIMAALALMFPTLEVVLPKPRRTWEGQPYWAPMFDAVARAVVWLETNHE